MKKLTLILAVVLALSLIAKFVLFVNYLDSMKKATAY
ncbi:MAG: hypothetical protein K0Q56_1697 [Sporolactobacillus laevolacticus]|jgi:hypothetical protein|nr:hypothetical protein [Sporolactobacillus laevolacticus]